MVNVYWMTLFFFFQAEDGIRDLTVTGVQTCALPICARSAGTPSQLISRRPLSVGGELGAFKLPPSAARNLFRVSATVRLSPWARITAKLGPGGALLMGE